MSQTFQRPYIPPLRIPGVTSTKSKLQKHEQSSNQNSSTTYNDQSITSDEDISLSNRTLSETNFSGPGSYQSPFNEVEHVAIEMDSMYTVSPLDAYDLGQNVTTTVAHNTSKSMEPRRIGDNTTPVRNHITAGKDSTFSSSKRKLWDPPTRMYTSTVTPVVHSRNSGIGMRGSRTSTISHPRSSSVLVQHTTPLKELQKKRPSIFHSIPQRKLSAAKTPINTNKTKKPPGGMEHLLVNTHELGQEYKTYVTAVDPSASVTILQSDTKGGKQGVQKAANATSKKANTLMLAAPSSTPCFALHFQRSETSTTTHRMSLNDKDRSKLENSPSPTRTKRLQAAALTTKTAQVHHPSSLQTFSRHELLTCARSMLSSVGDILFTVANNRSNVEDGLLKTNSKARVDLSPTRTNYSKQKDHSSTNNQQKKRSASASKRAFDNEELLTLKEIDILLTKYSTIIQNSIAKTQQTLNQNQPDEEVVFPEIPIT